MPRYVIEVGEEIDECWQCPCLFLGSAIKRCMMAKKPFEPYGDVYRFGRDMGFDEGRSSRPLWCPLKKLDDSSLE
jgi:hypothetical protein